MPDPISQEQAARTKAVEKYFRARTGEERRQALEELSKCPPAKKIETVEEALAKIEELENELHSRYCAEQKTKNKLDAVKGDRFFFVLLAIFLDICALSHPGSDDAGVFFFGLLLVLPVIGYKCLIAL